MNGLVTIFPTALLFSATFKKKVEMLCRDILTDPIRVVVGELGEVSTRCWSKKGPGGEDSQIRSMGVFIVPLRGKKPPPPALVTLHFNRVLSVKVTTA